MPRRLLPQNREMVVHCISRVVDRNFIFREPEKRHFHAWMRRLEKFCGVEVMTYCLMSNHFHLLVSVPDPATTAELTGAELRKLLPLIYRQRALRDAIEELDRAEEMAKTGSSVWLNGILDRYRKRRHNVSLFLKDLKQRFTRWYNRRNDRCGTLWEDRFRSVLVEKGEAALLTMAAYIDLNPIRAGLASDPKNYPWCGYAEAVAGVKTARRGLCAMLRWSSYGTNRKVTWATISTKYRLLLYDHGGQRDADPISGSKGRPGMSHEQVEAETAAGGELTLAQLLRCRLRHLCDGVVFGSDQFVDEFFEANRHRFGKNRTNGARTLPGTCWGELRVLRKLQKGPSGR